MAVLSLQPILDSIVHVRFLSSGDALGWASVGVLASLALAAVLAHVASRAGAAQKGKRANGAAPAAPTRVNHGPGGAWALVPKDGAPKVMYVTDDNMEWYVGITTKIYEVTHGIFYGEMAGDRLPAWKPGAFESALRALRAQAQEMGGWPDGGTLHEPLDDVAMTARLIATELNVAASAKLLQEYRDYRAEHRGGIMPALGWIRGGVAFIPCEDKYGRPILWIRPRYHKPGDADAFRDGLRTTLDAVKVHLMEKRRADGFSESNLNPLEQYAMVWDFGGAGMRNLDWPAFHMTIKEGAIRYPNMGSQIYVLNVAKTVRFIWNAASSLLDPRIRKKCFLISPKDVNDCMRQLVPEENLPPQFGGAGPSWPAPEEAETLEEQIGELAANVYRRAGVVPAGAKPSRHARRSEDGDAPRRLPQELQDLDQRRQGGYFGCCF